MLGRIPVSSFRNHRCFDIDNGLYVLSPTYVAASYLEGNITDSITGNPVANASVTILTTQVNQTQTWQDFIKQVSAFREHIAFNSPARLSYQNH
jgi:hypothetical protein